jgi:hypothetical protein
MALPTINRDDFRHVASEVIAASSGLLDWSALLQGYESNRADSCAGLNARAVIHRRLAEAGGPENLADAVAEIVRGAEPAAAIGRSRREGAPLAASAQ